MTSRRNALVYGMLFAIWAALMAWQVAEHIRVKNAARALLQERARYVAMTCGRILRAPGRLVVSKGYLEFTISQLVRPGETNSGELRSVVLVNRAGDIAAAAPTNVDFPREEMQSGPHWDGPIVWLPNLVDLGTNLSEDLIVLPFETITNMVRSAGSATNGNPAAATAPTNNAATDLTNALAANSRPRPGGRRGRPEFVQPSFMTQDEYKAMSQKKGAHNFFVGMSTQPVHDADSADFLIRLIIGLLGTAGVVGYGLAWQSLVKSSDLQLRLVRASEMNLHLKEMNLAAAGLAHETRNPLNIIRGLAQMISKEQDASPEIRAKTREMIDETDRVTAQLNEFINYSRPREVRRAPTDLGAVVSEVARTLNYDIEEKSIQLQIVMEPLTIEADEQLLRQALFNLVLNAIQAVPPKGQIRLRASKRNNEEAFIEISDNGPGVPQANRAEIFKPYFTTHPEGTGLGLSVVQQIVQAHGWDIECLPNDPAGALFRIAHIKLCGKD
ncbi:MAG: ATP-binding protein [Verrucomicrobiota bacterium]|jgi:signal transduction histidine kinase